MVVVVRSLAVVALVRPHVRKQWHRITMSGLAASNLKEVFEALPLLLEATLGKPVEVRLAVLRLISHALTAEEACWIPTAKDNPQFDDAAMIGCTSEAVSKEVTDFLLSSQGQRFERRPLKIYFSRLLSSGTTVAVLRLAGANLQRPDSSAAWDRFSWELSLVEQNLQLRTLLEKSRRQLKELRRDSQRIAQGNERLFKELLSNQDRLRSLSKGVLRVQEEERSRISRELHDGIGQSLTAVKINMDLIAREEGTLSLDGRARLEETREMAAGAIEEVREMSRLLRPRILDELGLAPALKWYVRSFSTRTGLDVRLDENLGRHTLSSEAETLMFRVTQEALNNVFKHSGSPTAQVLVDQSSQKVRLVVSDQGRGFTTRNLGSRPDSGSGLPGIRDRVSLLGGQMSIDSRPGGGTTLVVEIPSTDS